MSDGVLLIHQDPDILDATRSSLQANGYVVHAYPEFEVHLYRRISPGPELVILPWRSEEIARQVISTLEELHGPAATCVILLAPSAQYPAAIRALDFGVDDCISVPFPAAELIFRSRACLTRSRSRRKGERLASGRLLLDKAAHRVVIDNMPIEPAPAEFRLLSFFMENQGRVYSRAELLNLAWDKKVDAGPRTIDVHVRRLRKLFEPFGCEHLIQTVRGFGYRFSSESPGRAAARGKGASAARVPA